MGEIINFNKAKKARAKDDAKARAAQNRVAHGQPKAMTDLFRAKLEKAREEHESHKLDKPGPKTPK
jgi:hypothetical protein